MAAVRALIEGLADITIRGEKNMNAIEWALDRGHHAVVEYLTDEAPQVQAQQRDAEADTDVSEPEPKDQKAPRQKKDRPKPKDKEEPEQNEDGKHKCLATQVRTSNDKTSQHKPAVVVAVLEWDTKRVRRFFESLGPEEVWADYAEAAEVEGCDGTMLVTFEDPYVAREFGFADSDAKVVARGVAHLLCD